MEQAEWKARLDALAARKTAEAVAAVIEPFTTERDEPDSPLVAVGNAWTRRMFDGSFYVSVATTDDVPATSLVFVESREGNTVARNPSTLGGGEADKHLIYEGLSRVAADGVVGGQRTLGRGDLVLSVWHPELIALRTQLGLPRHPLQIVATLRGIDLSDGLLFNVPELPVIVLTVARGEAVMRSALAARPWIRAVVTRDDNDVRDAFRQLRQFGVNRLSCIGGRTLAESLLEARLVHDVYLTTSPVSAGEPDTPFHSRPLDGRAVVRKHGTGADAGVVFEHLRLG